MYQEQLPRLLSTMQVSGFCVGSLPFTDPHTAVEFVFDRPWIQPFWPELPRMGEAELMINRAMRSTCRDWSGYERNEAHGLYALKQWLRATGKRLPLLKCQVVGPLTLQVFKGIPFESGCKACLRQIEWQADFLRDVADRLLFVSDDPALGRLSRGEGELWTKLEEAYSYLYVRLSEEGWFLGIHTCASFSKACLKLPMHLYSFDALQEEKNERLEWGKATAAGLVLAPGVLPAALGGVSAQDLERAGLRISGFSGGTVLFGANCGHAHADVRELAKVYFSFRNNLCYQ